MPYANPPGPFTPWEPTRSNATSAFDRVGCDGKERWKEAIGYHRRSLAETAMSRLKSAFGNRLKNREPPSQAAELALRCKILNTFAAIGMSLSIWG